MQFDTSKKLTKQFYQIDAVKLAPKLLGKLFFRKVESEYLIGKIVEVEAYRGRDDEAAHTFNGKTIRNEVMFKEGGYLYVYFTYGMNFCANVVCGKASEGAAVLIRGVEPLFGLEKMKLHRFDARVLSDKEIINLTNGPAKFCKAFSITKKENGTDLTSSEIFLLDSEDVSKKNIIVTQRIGIKKSVELPWRFYIKDNPYVSKK